MNLRVLASVAGLLGGACWVVLWTADLAGSTLGWADDAHLAGLVLLGLALAGLGAGLVSRSAIWLRLIVGLALPLLVWSVYSVLQGDSDQTLLLDGVVGIVAILVALAALVLRRRHEPAEQNPRRSHGSHSR